MTVFFLNVFVQKTLTAQPRTDNKHEYGYEYEHEMNMNRIFLEKNLFIHYKQ